MVRHYAGHQILCCEYLMNSRLLSHYKAGLLSDGRPNTVSLQIKGQRKILGIGKIKSKCLFEEEARYIDTYRKGEVTHSMKHPKTCNYHPHGYNNNVRRSMSIYDKETAYTKN